MQLALLLVGLVAFTARGADWTNPLVRLQIKHREVRAPVELHYHGIRIGSFENHASKYLEYAVNPGSSFSTCEAPALLREVTDSFLIEAFPQATPKAIMKSALRASFLKVMQSQAHIYCSLRNVFPLIRKTSTGWTLKLEGHSWSLPELVARIQLFGEVNTLNQHAAVLEHIEGYLNLEIQDKSVITLGSGIGEFSRKFLDRGCSVIATDGRHDNVLLLRELVPKAAAMQVDLMHPPANFFSADLVVAENVLYHLESPSVAIAWAASQVKRRGYFVISTCVTRGEHHALNTIPEPDTVSNQAMHAYGSRPTLPWLVAQIRKSFNFVYVPRLQPNHTRFIADLGLLGSTTWPSRNPSTCSASVKTNDGVPIAANATGVLIIATHSKIDHLNEFTGCLDALCMKTDFSVDNFQPRF